MKLFTTKSIETEVLSRVLWLLFTECIMDQACS